MSTEGWRRRGNYLVDYVDFKFSQLNFEILMKMDRIGRRQDRQSRLYSTPTMQPRSPCAVKL